MIAADGTAVYPWNHGETLTAAALNAAIAQSSLADGGTTTGPLIFTGNPSAASGGLIYAHGTWSGVAETNWNAAYYTWNIDSDTVDATHAQGGGATGTYFGHSVSAGAIGGRTAHGVYLGQTGVTTLPQGQFYVASGAFSEAYHSCGGTSSVPEGSLFASNIGATLKAGAGYWTLCSGMEVDVGVEAGVSVQYKSGLSIVQFANDAVQGAQGDAAFVISNQMNGTAPGWQYGLAFGGKVGWWPFTPASTIMGAIASQTPGGPVMEVLNGIDFSAIAFVGRPFQSPGFYVAANGYVHTDHGMSCGVHLASGPSDFTYHIDLYNTQYGFTVTSDSNLNYIAAGGRHTFFVAGSLVASIGPGGITLPGLVNATNDAGAASGGVPVSGLYRNGSQLMVRVT